MKALELVMLAVLLCASWAQGQADENVAPAPAVAPAPPADDGRLPLEGDLTPEQLAKFLQQAQVRRLTMERNQVAAEIRDGMIYDPAKVDGAVKGLSEQAKNTWTDNAERICRAFALVDNRFGKAWELLGKGDFEAAAGAFKPLISERDTSYLSAAKRYCHAEALAGQGNNDDAVEAYTDLVKTMPDRFSFSALALLKAGRTYERMHRLYYAMTLYKLWVESFGILDAETAKELADKSQKIEADYKDPLGTLSGKMDEVQKRLAEVDSGKTTQQRQREIVAMLDDLIATAQENSQQSSSSQGQGQEKKPGEGQGEGQAGAQGQGKNGPPSGISQPSSPATVSRLVGGAVLRPENLRDVRPSDPTDDWGKLAPMERQKLLETFKESMPERYREMISDYYRKMGAEQKPN